MHGNLVHVLPKNRRHHEVCYYRVKTAWAHILCVNWLQGVEFKDERKETVIGELSEDQLKTKCSFSKMSYGAVIQCEFKSCFTSAYVRCAVEKGWIYHWNEMATDLDINDDE